MIESRNDKKFEDDMDLLIDINVNSHNDWEMLVWCAKNDLQS